jgi:catechol 2,3-dioxygenase-like lactoylglutathione lyase family enzyme
MSRYAGPDEQMVVELYVKNMKESCEFYRSLGFQVVKEEGSYAELKWGNALLFLEEDSGAPSPLINPVGNIRILVPNVDHYWVLSQKLGIPVIQPIENRHYGLRDFTIAGPDGMGLRFATRISDLGAREGNGAPGQ